MMSAFSLESYLHNVQNSGASTTGFDYQYLAKHQPRFQKTIELLDGLKGSAALEIGATDFFQLYLRNALEYEDVWGTVFAGNKESKIREQTFSSGGLVTHSTIVDLQLEDEFFPIREPHFDLVMLCEVLEHMDVDPMFCLCEINRITKTGGKLLVSTPNACSARNAYKCCLGHRPHFYMQYHKNRDRYRHNFEHDVHSVRTLLEAAGFRILGLETHDVFEETSPTALAFLQEAEMPLAHRGDDIFVIAEKAGLPTDRWPAGVYD
jgi:SAM-dependent methyltransferase